MSGIDSLYSIVQMPPGDPVASVAINGSKNAGILAAQILATADVELSARVQQYKSDMKGEVERKASKLEDLGYGSFLDQMGK